MAIQKCAGFSHLQKLQVKQHRRGEIVTAEGPPPQYWQHNQASPRTLSFVLTAGIQDAGLDPQRLDQRRLTDSFHRLCTASQQNHVLAGPHEMCRRGRVLKED